MPTIDGMSEVQTCFQGRFGEEVGSDEFGAHMHFGPGTKSQGTQFIFKVSQSRLRKSDNIFSGRNQGCHW